MCLRSALPVMCWIGSARDNHCSIRCRCWIRALDTLGVWLMSALVDIARSIRPYHLGIASCFAVAWFAAGELFLYQTAPFRVNTMDNPSRSERSRNAVLEAALT